MDLDATSRGPSFVGGNCVLVVVPTIVVFTGLWARKVGPKRGAFNEQTVIICGWKLDDYLLFLALVRRTTQWFLECYLIFD